MIRFALILFLVFASVNAHAEDFNVCEDENQETVCKPRIMHAIEQGDFLLVKEIVESGFDVNTHFPVYYGTIPPDACRDARGKADCILPARARRRPV